MTAILGRPAGPDGSGGAFDNDLDTERASLWHALGARAGVLSGLTVSGVDGLMAVDVSAGAALLAERDGSGVQLPRGYFVHTPDGVRVTFGPASAAARNDALVVAFVDVEDGPVGTGNLAVGAHLVVVPGVSGATAVRTDAQITARLGRGGWHRLRNFPIAPGDTQVNIAASTKAAVEIHGRNRLGIITVPGWSINLGEWIPSRPGFVWAQVVCTRNGPTITAQANGNISDTEIATGWPDAIRPSGDKGFLGAYRGDGIAGTARVTINGQLILTGAGPNVAFAQTGGELTIQGEIEIALY